MANSQSSSSRKNNESDSKLPNVPFYTNSSKASKELLHNACNQNQISTNRVTFGISQIINEESLEIVNEYSNCCQDDSNMKNDNFKGIDQEL